MGASTSVSVAYEVTETKSKKLVRSSMYSNHFRKVYDPDNILAFLFMLNLFNAS